MKILVVGDCHGVKPVIDEEAEEADVILATGDICGDSDKMRNAMFQAMDTEKMWYDILGRQEAEKAVKKSLEKGEKVLEYLDSFNKPVFLVPGNWDWNGEEEGWKFLEENRFQEIVDDYRNIHNINRESMQDSNFCYIGYGPCPGPEVPQYEDDKPEDPGEMDEIRKNYEKDLDEIGKLFEKSKNPVIFLSHNVPHDTSLDRIENPESPADGRHYGSLVVKELIEEKSPVLSAAGHMHEGFGEEKIGETLAINAGLHSTVMVEIQGSEIVEKEFMS